MAEVFLLLVALGLSALVGQLGKNRKIGFGWSFALSFFLSPIIGLIITLCSKKNDIEFVDVKKED
jgi:Na+-driven multidrug efflux pump